MSILKTKWLEAKTAMANAKHEIDQQKARLAEAVEHLKECTIAEFKAFRNVPEDERGELSLSDDVMSVIFHKVMIQCRKKVLQFNMADVACVSKAWCRAIPKPHLSFYTEKVIAMGGRTLLFSDRAIDVNTKAILATFDSTQHPQLTPDGETLLLSSPTLLEWTSLRHPPHHPPISISYERLLQLEPKFETVCMNEQLNITRYPGVLFSSCLRKYSSGIVVGYFVINALNGGSVRNFPYKILDVDLPNLRIIESSYGYNASYRGFNGLILHESAAPEYRTRNRRLSPDKTHYVVKGRIEADNAILVIRTSDNQIIDSFCPAPSKSMHFVECSIDNDKRVHILSLLKDGTHRVMTFLICD